MYLKLVKKIITNENIFILLLYCIRLKIKINYYFYNFIYYKTNFENIKTYL